MAKRKLNKSTSESAAESGSKERTRLPAELESRLLVVWSKLGHLVDWCNSGEAWTKRFCGEARPYRETFYWEAIAEMVLEYFASHPGASQEKAFADCLIATQCPICGDDPEQVVHFRKAWQQLLQRSQPQIEAFTKADLELARQEGNYETVARQYAAESDMWQKGDALA